MAVLAVHGAADHVADGEALLVLGHLQLGLAELRTEVSSWVSLSYSVATWSATSSHSTLGTVRHCSSVTVVQFTVSMGVHT